MTTVIRVGGSRTVTPIRVGDDGPDGGPPTAVGVTRPADLADLGDVEGTDGAPVGAVLTKVGARAWTGRPPEVTDWWSGEGPPPLVIPGASPGDLYFDTVGKGLYRLT
jgi:hypothetical protein